MAVAVRAAQGRQLQLPSLETIADAALAGVGKRRTRRGSSSPLDSLTLALDLPREAVLGGIAPSNDPPVLYIVLFDGCAFSCTLNFQIPHTLFVVAHMN